jgi:hypothetical protein
VKIKTVPCLRRDKFVRRKTMKTTKMLTILILAFGLIVCLPKAGRAEPIGMAFTYQGRLIDANKAADGLYDFQFKLFDANSDGNQLGLDVNQPEVDVIDGYFTITLDFNDANAFNGEALWLDIGVRPGNLNDPNVYTTLSPRQQLTPTPYALYAKTTGGGGGGSAWQSSGSNICYNAGNVGIMTNNPHGLLQVGEPFIITSDEDVGISDAPPEYTPDAKLEITTGTSKDFLMISSEPDADGDVLIVKHNGNVGIGTTNPGIYKLNVNGNISASNSLALPYTAAIYGVTTQGQTAGVYGQATTGDGAGVYGENDSGNGVIGDSNSSDGVSGESNSGQGVRGWSNSGDGVNGWSNSGDGVNGESSTGYGVHGWSSSVEGVYGESISGYGVHGVGVSTGVCGESVSTGVLGRCSSGGGSGVHGESSSGRGVYGESISGRGVYGVSSSVDGVYGESISGNGVGGNSSSGNGVSGYSSSGNGVYGQSSSGWAGYFVGKVQVNSLQVNNSIQVSSNVLVDHDVDANGVVSASYVLVSKDLHVNGNLTKGSGSFKIDHPLDPANKFLQHSFVESPDMMNIYNGNIILDENGEASVTLPEWFQSLNKESRYQLTCIGGFAPVYIAEKISDNHFKIAGGKPGMEVSWQVTGIRQDPYAVANRIVVEEDKPVYARGYYLHPEVYGQPKDRSIVNAPKPSLPEEQ